MVPPTFLVTLISLKSTLVLSLLMTFKTASTARGESSLELVLITLEDKEVFTHWINCSLSSKSTVVAKVFKISWALASALMKPSEIVVGWIYFSNKLSQAFKRDPAITATDVVPSPASIS